MSTSLLQVAGLTKRFGGIAAVNNVSFDLQAGRIVGLIGPNGAGKTTLVNLITGVHQASAGSTEKTSAVRDRSSPPCVACRARSRSCNLFRK